MRSINLLFVLQVRICRERNSGQVYAMKKLKKSEMLRRGQVYIYQTCQVVLLRFCMLYLLPIGLSSF